MHTVVVTGANGMLGQALVQVLRPMSGIRLHALGKGLLDVTQPVYQLPVGAVVVNCAGITTATIDIHSPSEVISVNSLGPHNLREACRQHNCRLVHISTDCVFSGRIEFLHHFNVYTESHIPDPTTLYGRSKLLGEVTDAPNLTIRTSFVGHGERGLVAWLLSVAKRSNGTRPAVDGYVAAYWNGTTAPVLAKYLVEHVLFNRDLTGLLNVASGDILSKCALLELIVETHRLPLDVTPVTEPVYDRTLSRAKMLDFGLPELTPTDQAVAELAAIYHHS